MPNPKALGDVERQQFLADKHVTVLSVAADDGRPPASFLIWYDYAPGGNIRINTAASRRKARLIEKAGQVTLVVEREEPPYRHVIVEGTVVEVTSPAPAEAQEAIATRYLGEEGGREFARRLPRDDSVMFTVRPDRWITAEYSAG